MRRTSGTPLVRLILLAGVLASQLLGQGDRGVITGTVTDASGGIVPGAVMSESPPVSRIFSVKERAHLEMRVEAFNVLNRVFFAPLGGATTIGNANYGLWRAQANGWRTMQLVSKMTW